MMRKTASIILLLLTALAACSKVTKVDDSQLSKLSANPYANWNGKPVPPPSQKIDSASLAALHQLVLSTKCAMPACHDGSFEPDMRTIESAYSTLVYHPVIKNDAAHSFTYRVVPYDTAKSWMHLRITTNDKVLGRMPLYDSLAPWQVNMITNWILNGAKDIFGNVAREPNTQPTTFGIVAYLPDFGFYRVDTTRKPTIINAFYIPKNTNVDIYFGLYDDKTAPPQFIYNKVKFSTDASNFSNALTKDLVLKNPPYMAPAFGNNGSYPYYYHVSLNTSLFKPGDMVFMRVYVQDADHSSPTEIPSTGSQYGLQTYFSFVVTP
jgi:hypothetical protein